MSLTEEQLNEVEEMAGLFFSPGEIALNLEFSEEQSEGFKLAVQTKMMDVRIVRAYFKGWLTTEVELRKAIKQSALNGSSPSQQMMQTYQREGRV